MSHQASVLYVLVKRGKVTIALYVEPQLTIKAVKDRILAIINTPNKPSQLTENPDRPDWTSDEIQLRFEKDIPLADATTVTDAGIVKTAETLYLLFQDANGDWEPIDIHEPEAKGAPKETIDQIKAHHSASTTTLAATAATSS